MQQVLRSNAAPKLLFEFPSGEKRTGIVLDAHEESVNIGAVPLKQALHVVGCREKINGEIGLVLVSRDLLGKCAFSYAAGALDEQGAFAVGLLLMIDGPWR